MGRGRAKAKQQKVARELKYNSSHFTDLDALRRELSSEDPAHTSSSENYDEDDEYEDDWPSSASR